MSCKIDKGAAFDCDAIEQGGIGNYVMLINKEDYDDYQTLTVDGTSNEITALVLKAATQGYRFESSKGSAQIIPNAAYRGVSAIDGFNHQIDIRIPQTSQLINENIAKMRFQKVVAIIPLLNGKFELYGQNVGLRISDVQKNSGDADMGGSLQFILSTPENDPPEIALPALIASTFDITTLDTPAA